MRKIITSVLCILLAAVLISLGGYFLTVRNESSTGSDAYENFQFVSGDSSVEEEVVYTYTDIEYTEDGFVPSPSEVIAQICTGEDMLVIAQHPDLKYKLMNDIDMSGIDWVPVSLTGSFDGQGHTIYNLTVTTVSTDGMDTKNASFKTCTDTRFAGLFSVIDGAEVINLTLVGASIDVEPEQSCYIGTIAGYSNNSVISGCSVKSRLFLHAYGLNNGIGGILGYGSATISGCNVESEIVYSDMHTPDYSSGSIGGLVGDGYLNISDCTVNADIYATANMYLYCGGVIGQFVSKGLAIEGNPGISGTTASGIVNCGFRSKYSSSKYCSNIYGYLSGVRAFKLDESAFSSKISVTSQISVDLSPECECPDLIETVTEATCQELGYSTHTCKNCGYSYIDSYVLPHHGEIVTDFIEEPKPGVPGKAECYCDICNKLLYTATVETSEQPPALSLSYVVLDMEYGATALIDAENAKDNQLVWNSDQPEIVSVDETGHITANRLGSAIISCSDGETTVSCKVNVSYSSEQVFFRKFLFGWIWMK